ncbi:hypothetical protein EG68_01515 [Paragonimus skrjabini miyazakii]|uniref:Uncharacterized protein n=1 Tax=Paragonimus skrjabini miyazakii TaxID=59628 RepID=A0A8S9Z336_9TREM|nr:hypothetical protein EG68_01515 [Paragonimus skrjabini miyazakii]
MCAAANTLAINVLTVHRRPKNVELAQVINYRFEKVMIDNVMPMVICVEPPGGYFLACVINELVILLQITFIMDYMDPS